MTSSALMGAEAGPFGCGSAPYSKFAPRSKDPRRRRPDETLRHELDHLVGRGVDEEWIIQNARGVWRFHEHVPWMISRVRR